MKKSWMSIALLCGAGIFGPGLLFGNEEDTRTMPGRTVSLPEVLGRALRNNFDIKLARFDQKINRYDLPAALSVYDTLLTAEADYTYDNFKKSSEFYGDLSKTGNYSLGLAKTIPGGTALKLDFANQYSYSDSFFATINPSSDSYLKLSFTQPLLKNWGGKLTRGEVELVRINVANFNLLTWEIIERSLAWVTHTYWDLVETQEEVRLRQKMEERARYLYQLLQEQLKMGMVERVDLLAAEANLKIREADLILAQEKLTTISRLLQLLINDTDSALLLPEETLEIPREEVADTFPDNLRRALENRWDYLRTLKELEAKEIEVELKKNSRWPQVDLVGSFARNGLSDEWGKAAEGIFSENNPQYYVGLQFSHFLENRRADSEAEKADLEKGKALVQIKKLEREIYTQVDEELRIARVSRELALREDEIRDLQREKLAEEEKRLKYGRSSSKTVIDYQNDLLLAQLNTVKALTVYQKSLVDLEVIQGVFLRKQMGME